MPVALTLAGSDPSGGAGIQADLKTFHQHGVYGMAVLTLLTVQNTRTVEAVEILRPELVLAQLDAVLEDIPPHAAKTGALGCAAVIEAIARRAEGFGFPLIVDPVMISKHGAALIDSEAVETLITKLLPHTYLVTPNLHEAAALAEMEVVDEASMERACVAISRLGPKHVLVKGGHLKDEALDLLWSEGEVYRLPSDRLDTPNTHGTGCVYSAAITARLAKGRALVDAVRGAKQFVTEAIRTNPGLGRGYGPTNLHAPAGA
ncbi:MAG: bifunctional hydroxymethylpyrimidine kinase/phosphomethylpyrimidine kinase [Armatimonadetes bacterium]|nr:bifunctional hydroxymethylpyrimidine kinase/phosphomethylpyrimidine kinase [Armatimonadota bacterium]